MPPTLVNPIIQLLLNGAITGNGTTLLQTLLVQVILTLKAKATETATPWDDRILDALVGAAETVRKLAKAKP